MPLDEHRLSNRDNWDARVPIHWQPDGYDAPGFAADPSRISGVVRRDRDRVGEVNGKTLLHLQCHFGMDTISWARLGAVVTGIDFSESAIDAARRLSDQAGTAGRFVVSELYDTPTTLEGERFDVIYTGVGAINWLPDIRAWADVVATMLAPGGTFFMREGHPVMWSLAWPDEPASTIEIGHPYFEVVRPEGFDTESSYAGTGTLTHTRTYEWNHGVGEVLGALLASGLVIDHVAEHRACEWQGHPMMEETADGMWVFPEPWRDRVPVMWEVRAAKPPVP